MMTTILLVDDSRVDRRLFGTMLETHGGYRVQYAEHGADALKQLEDGLPDLVVTDMQMPEMDGLQLVTVIRNRYPQLPVILLTGKGSEALATRALQQGAAGYVPKSHGIEFLLQTVNRVLVLALPDADFQRLIAQTGHVDFRIDLPNDRAIIDSLVAVAQNLVTCVGICDANGRLQVGVALEHALLNAMYHGNLELTGRELDGRGGTCGSSQQSPLVKQRMAEAPYCQRKISVAVRMNRDEARFTINDKGPGFNVEKFSEVGLSKAAGDSEHGGQGLFLMWAFMDGVTFNPTGNTVTLVKRSHATIPQPPPEDPVAVDKDIVEHPSITEELGQLVPIDGGASHLLAKRRLIVGREPSCDIILNYSDISHHHCLLYVFRGWWFVRDLGSKNGIRINKVSTKQHRIAPGSILTIGKHTFEMKYRPHELGAEGITPPDDPF